MFAGPSVRPPRTWEILLLTNFWVFSGIFGYSRIFSGILVHSRELSCTLGYYRVFSDILMYFGYFGYFWVFCGIFGYSRIFSDILGYSRAFLGIFRYFRVFSCIFGYSRVFSGIFGHFRVFSGILVYFRVWNVLECSGLCTYVQFVFSFEQNLYYFLISPVLCGKMGAYVYDIYLFGTLLLVRDIGFCKQFIFMSPYVCFIEVSSFRWRHAVTRMCRLHQKSRKKSNQEWNWQKCRRGQRWKRSENK